MRQTVWAACTGSVFTMLLTGSAVGALLIKQLGGTDFQSMLPASILLLAQTVQIPVSLRIPPGRGKAFMLRAWLAALGILTAAFFLPAFLSGRGGVTIFLVVLGAGVLVNGSGSTFWFPLLHDLVPVHRRGRFFGRLRAIWSFVSFSAILAAGFFLGKNPAVWRFQVVFGVALVLYFVRIFFVARIPAGNSLSGGLDFEDWRHYVRNLFRQRALVVFLAYYGVLGFCMGFLSQPLVLYMKARGFPAKDNVIIFSFHTLGTVLSYLISGSLVDRFGTKRIFLVAHLVLCLTCFGVVGIGMGPNEYAMFLLPAAMIVAGGIIAASGVACTAQLFHLIPNRGRAFYLSLAMIITSVGVAVSPLLVGCVLDVVGDGWRRDFGPVTLDMFQVLLLIAGVLSLLAIGILQAVPNVHPNRETAEK
ncbi:MAG: MFS transporter [Phycisphaerae bacterium]|nr:MFS transporter [Phycisphaerae bacterium]